MRFYKNFATFAENLLMMSLKSILSSLTKQEMLTILITTFCVFLILANILETKQIAVWGNFTITGGLLVFPATYIINDCLTEVWGYTTARRTIYLAFLMNFLFVMIAWGVDALPAADYWTNDAGFHAVFGLTPRVAVASFTAFFLGSLINSKCMAVMKNRQHGRHFSFRAIMSTVVGETIDSVIFFPIAFWNIIPLRHLLIIMLSQMLLKTAYEILCLPFTIQLVKYLKRL